MIMKLYLLPIVAALLLPLSLLAQEQNTYKQSIGINFRSVLHDRGGTELQYSYRAGKVELRLSAGYSQFESKPDLLTTSTSYTSSEGRGHSLRTGAAYTWRKNQFGFAAGTDLAYSKEYYTRAMTTQFSTSTLTNEDKYYSVSPFLGISYFVTERFSLRLETFGQLKRQTSNRQREDTRGITMTESTDWNSQFFRDFRLFARLHF